MRMRALFVLAAAWLGLLSSSPARAASICPATSSTTSDCNFLITISGTGSIIGSIVSGQTPFDVSTDGGDDMLVGVSNSYTRPLLSLTLTGAEADSAANAGVFDFDNDGICNSINSAYCGAATTGYEGPNSTFSNLQIDNNFLTSTGSVLFSGGLATNSTTYFSLEGNPATLTTPLVVDSAAFGAGPTSAVPEPSEALLFLSAIPCFFIFRKRRFGAAA